MVTPPPQAERQNLARPPHGLHRGRYQPDSRGSDHLPATLALAAVAPMLAVIPISRLWRRRK